MEPLTFHIELLDYNEPVPYDLLELADPSRTQINDYLESGNCYIAKLGSEMIGVLVLDKVNDFAIEVKNIAIKESFQAKGYGKLLLIHAEEISKKNDYKKLRIGTGNSSIGQLALYQKEGFEISNIDIDFFIKNYNEPIFENGIQCKHMIILEKNLT